MGRRSAILLIDDDPDVGRLLGRALREDDPAFTLQCFETARAGEEAVAFADPPADCILLDYRLPDATGLECLRRLRGVAKDVPVIMLTGADSAEIAVEAMKLGASDYVVKHGRYLRTVVVKVREALGRRELERTASRVRETAPGFADSTEAGAVVAQFAGIVGGSAALRAALALAERAARSSVPVLLEGESGSGKEVFARAIHERGPRARSAFIAQNCAALPEALLESELFGHVRGAFTGADSDRRGLFEAASGGTLFLDEVSETSLAIQAKLLRVLQDGEIRPLGSTQARKIDVRIVSAANVDLAAAVKEGKFRKDLFYRLRVFPVRIPPLRERGEDIRVLARHFASVYATREQLETPEISDEVFAAFERYAWPGNVRELQNEMHRLVLCAEPGSPIGLGALSPAIALALEGGVDADERALKSIVQDVEVAMIVERLREHGNNREATARSLGITREALWAKMKKLGVEVRQGGVVSGADHREKEEDVE
ncbi:MAG: sigma-54-dependent Fis family transcriptional regulator [Deltaproteobacteria bacterium]|nr:sigma-54-dependent Fis family transcriptional regulator [Deltaproteobacteria bacterium]